MLRATAVILALVLGASAAVAAPRWDGPGWYQVEDGDFTRIYDGPFDSKRGCEATLPPDREDALYDCAYLKTQPAWDD